MNTAAQWYALEVKQRFEKHISSLLSAKGFETYLPIYHPQRQWKNRRAKVELALFPGYLFCRFDAVHRLPVVTTPGVYGIVTCSKKPAPVDECELDTVRRVLATRVAVESCEIFRMGQRVLIEEGPLRGVVGRIVANGNKTHRLYVSVTILQRSVAAEVNSHWLKTLSEVEAAPDEQVSVASGWTA